MPMPKYREPLATTTVELTERQRDTMRAQVRAGTARTVSEIVRKALDNWLGLETVTLDPLANEKEVA
jgi:Arc/MetJ-type ribon-helix-helix transcriptional regulator